MYCANCQIKHNINVPMQRIQPPIIENGYEWFECTRKPCTHKTVVKVKDTTNNK